MLALVMLVLMWSAGARVHAAASADADARPSEPGSGEPGPKLADALEDLRTQGFNVVYSTALVKPRYRISREPSSELGPEARARALLAPFGLSLEHVPPDTWYVVRSHQKSSVIAAPPGPAPAPAAAKPIVEQVLVSSSRYRLVR